MLTFITGPFGSGKTTQLIQLHKLAAQQGVLTAGVICPAVFEEGVKTGIDALLLPTEKLLHLAQRYSDGKIKHETMWNFDPSVFKAINQHLDDHKAPLLIIDELGPQEFLHNRGFTSALKILDDKTYTNALVVVRPSLLDEAQKRWGPAAMIDVSIEKMSLDKLISFKG